MCRPGHGPLGSMGSRLAVSFDIGQLYNFLKDRGGGNM